MNDYISEALIHDQIHGLVIQSNDLMEAPRHWMREVQKLEDLKSLVFQWSDGGTGGDGGSGGNDVDDDDDDDARFVRSSWKVLL